MYDGFISYSHAADDLLAPRLQSGLQRFAKPWWKRRALRIFRDESSLSANPHLWSSITEALDSSGWFVLLLSPDAANSEWVNQEIEYWRRNKDPTRILPVLTDGTFEWTDGDVSGASVPEQLQGTFLEEPRWVDMRFARDETDLDLKDPRFADAVADIASALRGLPKDELASEEVKQHRRTIRTAWTAGAALLALAIAAIGFGIQSSNNAIVAKSRELAAAATSTLADDPELSMMLALESIRQTPEGLDPSPQGVIALRQALAENRLHLRTGSESGGGMAAISPDGTTIYHAGFFVSDLTAFDIESETEVWSTTLDGGSLHAISVSPDGELVAVGITSTDVPGQVAVLDAAGGQVTQMLEPGACGFASVWTGFTPDGRYLGVDAGSETCGQEPGEYWVDLYDTETWEPAHRLALPETRGIVIAGFNGDTSRVLIFAQPESTTAELRSFPELELINTFEGASWAALSPDGQRVVLSRPEHPDVRPVLVEADTGNLVSYLEIDTFLSHNPFAFSADGTRLAVTTRDSEYIFDAYTGATLKKWRASGFEYSHSFTPDGDRILTTSDDGAVIWNISTDVGSGGAPLRADGLDLRWMNDNSVVDGPRLAVWALIGDEATPDLGFGFATLVVDPETLSAEASRLGLGTAQLPDGRIILWEVEAVEIRDGPDRETGPTVIWDPETDETTIVEECRSHETATSDCFATRWIESSSDGTVFAMSAEIGEATRKMVRVYETQNLDLLGEFEVPLNDFLEGTTDNDVLFIGEANQVVVRQFDGEEAAVLDNDIYHEVSFSSDGSLVFTMSRDGNVEVFETDDWESLTGWRAHAGLIRGVALSDDESMLATTGEDDFVNIWDIAELEPGTPPPLLDRIPAGFPSDAAWLSDTELVIFLAVEPLAGINTLRVSLEVGDVVNEARERLTRGFTPEECAIYQIEDCPTTLKAMLEG